MMQKLQLSPDHIRQDEKTLARFFSISLDIFYIAGFDGYFKLVNPAFEKLSGYTREELLSVPITGFIHPEDVEAFKGELKRLFTGIPTSYFENRFRCKDGSYKWMAWTSYPLIEEQLIYSIAHDQTERKHMEQEMASLLSKEQEARIKIEAADHTKDEFLATLSHELRTPLTAILGWSRMLRTGQLDEYTTRSAFEIIERNAEAQKKLIDELLDISRIIAGKIHLDLRLINLFAIVEPALAAVRPAADSKDIKMEIYLDKSAGVVYCDPARMQQVIWNLLSNAVKFTPNGGSIEISLKRKDQMIQIMIKDTGQGITSEFMPHVFERFRQADASTKRAHGGLGLGLAIVKHLVELHDGKVLAKSDGEGKGAIFTVDLPIAFNAANNETNLTNPERGNNEQQLCEPVLNGLRVLIVDDEPDTRDMIYTFFKYCKAQVKAVATVNEVLSFIEESAPDVLISDISMPDIDGYDLIKKVRSFEVQKAIRIPVIGLTAHAGVVDRQTVLNSGFDLYMSKPIDLTALAQNVVSLAKK